MISCTSLGNGAAGQTPAALCRTCQQPPESSPASSGLHTRLSPPLPSQTLKTAFRSPPQPFSGSPVASVIASRVRTVSLAEPHGRPPFPPAAAPPATRPPARRSCGGGCRPLFHDPAPRSPSHAPNSCAACPARHGPSPSTPPSSAGRRSSVASRRHPTSAASLRVRSRCHTFRGSVRTCPDVRPSRPCHAEQLPCPRGATRPPHPQHPAASPCAWTASHAACSEGLLLSLSRARRRFFSRLDSAFLFTADSDSVVRVNSRASSHLRPDISGTPGVWQS